MSKRQNTTDDARVQPSSNGTARRRRNKTATADEARASKLVQESLSSPGVIAIPEKKIVTAAPAVKSIKPRRLSEDGDAGTVMRPHPNVMTVKLDRPNPHSWNRFSTHHVLETALLTFKPTRDSIPEHFFVGDERLEDAVRSHLKAVVFCLVFDVAAGGDVFAWLVPASPYSPYYAALTTILGQGEEVLAQTEYRILPAERRGRKCEVRHRPNHPESPLTQWPTRDIGTLCYEAMMPDHVISDPSHPVYRNLTSGGQLT
jgi:hypothetical protein